MKYRRAVLITAVVSCCVLVLAGARAAAHRQQNPVPPGSGVVVERAPGGFQPGDVIHTWVRAPRPPSHPSGDRGAISSPFDLYTVEYEHAQRGVVSLHGARGAESISLEMPSAESSLESLDWGVGVRPQLSGATLAAYQEGLELASGKRPLDAARRWKQLATEPGNQGTELAIWLHYAAGKVLADARLLQDAIATYREAEQLATHAKSPRIAAFIASVAGRASETNRDLVGASELHARAVELLSPFGESMFLALAQRDLGAVAFRRSDMPGAERAFESALRIREKLSPGSRAHAGSLSNAAAVAAGNGDSARAYDLNRRSLEILERILPASLQVATALTQTANLATDVGDLEQAEALHRRALAIRETLKPGEAVVAASLNNLGTVASNRGDVATARDRYSRALEILIKLDENSEVVVSTLLNLGTIEEDQVQAEALYRRALTISEAIAPETLTVAKLLHNLGAVASRRKDPAQANELYRRALAITEKVAPRNAIRGQILLSVSSIEEASGDLKEAERLKRMALGVYQTVAPGSDDEARVSYFLGVLLRKTGRLQEARDLIERGVVMLEQSAGRVGGDDVTRSVFRAERAPMYADHIDVLHQLRDDERAFHFVERSRASSLLRLLAERDVLSDELPPDLVRQRQILNAEYDRLQTRMASLHPVNDATALQQASVRLRELRAEREQIVQQIRKASARVAAVQYPQPFDLDRVRSTLDAGTVLLSYSVAKDRTLLFVVRPASARSEALQVFDVAITDADLRQEVTRFRRAIERQEADPHVVAARRLYDLLIAPAEKLIGPAERVLISPDGPLHGLPFGALVRPASPKPAVTPASAPNYFVSWKPLHVIASATVYAEVVKQPRRATGSQMMLAFGDPVLPSSSAVASEGAPAAEIPAILRRNSLQPLPSSRREVNQIAALYPAAASAHLGDDATEERVKELAGRAKYLHFATHGVLDERSPLDSGLVLTPAKGTPQSRRENGVLQAWEIFDHMRLSADLVVLSACETALGTELGGEGLVSLSRAFQYAGARSVLASLWRVADDSTADLMTRFYRHLRAGRSKDVALRNAQMELMKTASGAHPFHWAGFTLSGDWKDGAGR